MWVPRGLSVRVGKLLTKVFLDLLSSIDVKDEVGMELNSLLLYHFSRLILSVPCAEEAGVDGAGAKSNNRVHKLVRKRLQLTEAGSWRTLADDLSAQASSSSIAQDVGRAFSEEGIFRRVVSKVRGGCNRAAKNVLVGPVPLPPSEVTAAATKALFSTSPSNTPGACFPDFQQLPRCAISLKAVRRRVYSLRTAAEPGASGFRFSHLRTAMQIPEGSRAVQLWCQLWANGELPQVVVKPFLHLVARPFDKGGGGVRPIVLGELLVKLPMGCVLDVHQSAIQEILGYMGDIKVAETGERCMVKQFGVGMADGVGQLVTNMDTITKAAISLDLINAFGDTRRARVVSSMQGRLPSMIRAFRQLWDSGVHRVWVQVGPNQWESFAVYDGLFQGFCEASAAFALALQIELQRAAQEAADMGIRVQILSYNDDTYFVVDPHGAATVIAIIERILAEAGWQLQRSKCCAWVRDVSTVIGTLHSVVPQRLDGLPMTGTACDGDIECHLGPFGLSTEPAHRRLESAKRFAAKIRGLAWANLDISVLQSAWRLLHSSLSKSLAFDLRILSPQRSSQLARLGG